MLKEVWHLSMVLAMLGFVASFVVHILSWFGLKMPIPVFGLHLGVMVLWLPMMLASVRLVGFTWSWNYYQHALRGCPAWMRNIAYGLNIYAIANFLGFLGISNSPQPERLLSGFWMMFYFSAFAILYSAIHIDDGQCTNGHKLLPYKKVCPECGAPRAEVR